MKKFFTFHLFSYLVFTAIIVCLTNSYAEKNIKLDLLFNKLGVSQINNFSEEPISDIMQGRVFKCRVIDTAKLDAFKEFEEVELTKLEGDEWELKNPETGKTVNFIVQFKDEDQIEVIKTASSLSPEQVASSISEQLNLKGKFALGVKIGYANYSNDHYKVFSTKVDTELDDAAYMKELNFSYFFINYISVELSSVSVDTNVYLSGGGSSGNVGELQQQPIFLTGRFHIPIQNKIVPYAGGGIGYFLNYFDQKKNNVINSIYGSGADIDVSNTWGYLIDGGLDYFSIPGIALNLDAKYIWNKFEADVGIPGSKKMEFDANMFVLGVGVKIYF